MFAHYLSVAGIFLRNWAVYACLRERKGKEKNESNGQEQGSAMSMQLSCGDKACRRERRRASYMEEKI